MNAECVFLDIPKIVVTFKWIMKNAIHVNLSTRFSTCAKKNTLWLISSATENARVKKNEVFNNEPFAGARSLSFPRAFLLSGATPLGAAFAS